MQNFCYDCVYNLGTAFNSVLSAGKEYEVGFNEVMNILGVPQTERQDILFQTFYFSEASGIPYPKLSPLNQFVVTIPPYVFYCLRNKLPPEEALRKEAHTILNDEASTFPRYLQEELGVKISQEIKGALWRPGPQWLSATLVKILTVLFTIFLAGLLFFLKESFFCRILSYIIGVLILIVWMYHLLVAKLYTRAVGSVHSFTIWQWNILPLLTSISLFLTGNIMFIPLGIIFFYIPRWLVRLSQFDVGAAMPFILSIVYGWYIGVRVGELFVVTFQYWRIVSGIAGIVVVQIVCSLIVSFITGLYDR